MKRVLLLSTLAACSLLPALALAAGGGEPAHFDAGALIRHTINLAILLAVLVYFLKTPVNDFLHLRRAEIKESLDVSFRAKQEAEQEFAVLEGRLENFEQELDTMLAKVREEGENERRALIQRAEGAAERLSAATGRSIEEEGRRIRRSLRNEAIDLAVGMAARSLTAQVGAADHGRLAREYVANIEEAGSR